MAVFSKFASFVFLAVDEFSALSFKPVAGEGEPFLYYNELQLSPKMPEASGLQVLKPAGSKGLQAVSEPPKTSSSSRRQEHRQVLPYRVCRQSCHKPNLIATRTNSNSSYIDTDTDSAISYKPEQVQEGGPAGMPRSSVVRNRCRGRGPQMPQALRSKV